MFFFDMTTALLLANIIPASSFAPSVLRGSLIRGASASQTAATAYAVSVSSPTAEDEKVNDDAGKYSFLPLRDQFGVYKIRSQEQHRAFLEANMDKLVVLKAFAPWCKACKRLELRYNGLAKNKKYTDKPILFADISVSENQSFIQSLGVVALPTLQFYANGQIMETFPAGPSNFPLIGKKCDTFISQNTNEDMTIKGTEAILEEPATTKEIASDGYIDTAQQMLTSFTRSISYFETMTESELEKALAKASFVTFEEGSVIVKEGNYGTKFYVIVEGEVDVCRRLSADLASKTSLSYLGNVVNQLKAGDYFGERSLITREPCAASVRATEKTKAFAFSRWDFPKSSLLSGKSDKAEVGVERQRMDQMYGLGTASKEEVTDTSPLRVEEESIIPLLIRFKLIRSVSRCVDYIVSNRVSYGQEHTRQRRKKFVKMLGEPITAQFKDAFDLIDEDGDGEISLPGMRRVMDSIGKKKTDEELRKVIETSNEGGDGDQNISMDDFIGLMAETEIYNLLTGTFQSLDDKNEGYVRAEDLDNVLSGVRGLISDDRKNVLTLGDKDILIDYEQFSKMLLGSNRK